MSRSDEKNPKNEQAKKPARLTVEEVENLKAEGLRLRRALEKRIAQQAPGTPQNSQIRFR